MSRRPGNLLTAVLTALFLLSVVIWTGVTTGWSVTIPVCLAAAAGFALSEMGRRRRDGHRDR